MQTPTRPRRTFRVSGKLTLLMMAGLALLFAAALYWSLLPLYSKGKEGLRIHPSAPSTSQPRLPR